MKREDEMRRDEKTKGRGKGETRWEEEQGAE